MSDQVKQTWDAQDYAANARFVSELGLPVVALLDPRPGEVILDLGCGDGALAEKLSEFGAHVVGIDASPEFVAATQTRGVEAWLMDAQALTFAQKFDAVFSNAALHWMRQPEAVIAGVWRALKEHGRFVGEFGGGDNVKLVRAALHVTLKERGIDPQPLDPWYFPSPADYQALLEAAGFRVVTMARFPRPTPLPGDIAGWLATFTGSFARSVPAAERDDWLAEVRERLKPDLFDADSGWTVDYVRLRFAAVKE